MQIVCLRRRSRESTSREDHEYTEGLPTLNLDLEDLDFGGEKIASLLFTRTVGKQNWLPGLVKLVVLAMPLVKPAPLFFEKFLQKM